MLGLTAGIAGAAEAATASASKAAKARALLSHGTYTNPISADFADTFADPAVILGKDGYWYSYATTDPLNEGEYGPDGKLIFHQIPMARSTNLTDWEYVGDAFTDENRPEWAEDTAGIWAPDVRYIDGQYVMYFGVTDTTIGDRSHHGDSAIGVATAPTPTGPWTVQNGPVVGPRQNPAGGDDYFWTFDATGFTDIDGNHYLYYGSYYGGIRVTQLTDDGLRARTATTEDDVRVAIDNRYEAPYVVYRDGFYYLFASSANCCAGPTTGYSVYVGRSTSPTGPFLDAEGVSMNQSEVGGTIVITPNGNTWVGPGHNAIVTDLAGQDWFVYHAIDRDDPWLNEPGGINERPMLMDRLDWINGWPVVRAGYWASDTPQPAPVTEPLFGDDFNRAGTSLKNTWNRDGAWKLAGDSSGERYATQQAASCNKVRFLTTTGMLPNDLRVEADVRMATGGSGGVVVRYVDDRNYAAAYIDSRTGRLVVDVVVNGRHTRTTSDLDDIPFDEWHNIAVEVRGNQLMAEVTDIRLNDPYAVVRVTLPSALASGRAGVASECGRVDVDNFSAARLYTPQTRLAPVPCTTTDVSARCVAQRAMLNLQHSDEFDNGTVGDGWTWVRGPNPDATETGGMLRWPTQAADTTGPGGNASILLRDAPGGPRDPYIVETKCTIDFGTDLIRNYQQCGLVAYINDDLFVRLANVAIWNTRQTEFLKEEPEPRVNGDYAVSTGGMLVGPSASTIWLRLAHRYDEENDEHEYRAATSRDGVNWIWGGVWTLPGNTDPRIGLVSLGWNGDANCLRTPQDPPCRATSQFDYFRVYTYPAGAQDPWGDFPDGPSASTTPHR